MLISAVTLKISSNSASMDKISWIALITDVFTKEKYRGQGYGKAIVKKLLTLSPRKDVYLVSRDYNVKFYEKIGFKVAKEIYEYKV